MDELRVVDSGSERLGDTGPAAFADAVEPHVYRMGRLARRLAGAEAGEDVLQEALTRAWVKRGQFDPRRGSLGSWLLAITADQAYKSWRRGRHVAHLAPPRESQGVDERLDLEGALRGLPARQRLAIDCYYFAGLTVAETAVVMRCSVGNVKSTLSDARKSLRHRLRTET